MAVLTGADDHDVSAERQGLGSLLGSLEELEDIHLGALAQTGGNRAARRTVATTTSV